MPSRKFALLLVAVFALVVLGLLLTGLWRGRPFPEDEGIQEIRRDPPVPVDLDGGRPSPAPEPSAPAPAPGGVHDM